MSLIELLLTIPSIHPGLIPDILNADVPQCLASCPPWPLSMLFPYC